jgi:hypothetical protein
VSAAAGQVTDPARGLPGTQGEWVTQADADRVAQRQDGGRPQAGPRDTGPYVVICKPNPFMDDRAVWQFTV